tara:strand:+ start:244 stop:459 length:216 start_codon:yes stop_codon:yes gene_type:complete
MSYSEVRSLPIKYRRWFLDRLAQEFRRKNTSQAPVTKNNPKTHSSIQTQGQQQKKEGKEMIDKAEKFFGRF